MLRPGRRRLRGIVEVDETHWGAAESGGATDRLISSKALTVVAAEQDGKDIERIRMARIADFGLETLHGFIRSSIESCSTVCTDGPNSYRELKGYIPTAGPALPQGLRTLAAQSPPGGGPAQAKEARNLSGSHRSPAPRRLLNEFVFRFNRRKSASQGKLFFWLAQQSVQIGRGDLPKAGAATRC